LPRLKLRVRLSFFAFKYYKKDKWSRGLRR
jgi:hypothetical protein